MKLRSDIHEPMLTISSTEIEDPKRDALKIDIADPRRMKLRMEQALPVVRASSSDKLEPRRTRP